MPSPPSSPASSMSHIRDCKGRQQNPGKPENQANGRGDIDLLGYIRVLHENGYSGPVDLEIIGAKDYSLEQVCIIAAEARGHMQACLQAAHAPPITQTTGRREEKEISSALVPPVFCSMPLPTA